MPSLDDDTARLTVGKSVGQHVYVHVTAIPELPGERITTIAAAAELARVLQERDFNVVKLSKEGDELSLLAYSDFFDDPFPSLAKSWRISLSRRSVVYRTYEQSRNPPILHRKELLIPASLRRAEYLELTAAAESLGLFDDTTRIGQREHWLTLIAERGYLLQGHRFVPTANCEGVLSDDEPLSDEIHRYRTALSRTNLSAPVQALWRSGLIAPGTSFFDYGCGRGDDIRALTEIGVDAAGWDPHYAPDAEKRTAAAANIGFVINVIEDLAERVAALQGAYACAERVLSVAAMLSTQAPIDGRAYRDGFLTSRRTFQKYYSQTQLRDFIEQTLDEPAIAAGPGVFLVFKEKTLEQRFLAARYGSRLRAVPRLGLSVARAPRPPRAATSRPVAKTRTERAADLYQANRSTFEQLWMRCRELSRFPDTAEIEPTLAAELCVAAGSLTRAMRIAQLQFDTAELDRSERQKRADLLAFAALQEFDKRRPYRQLDAAIQRSIRYFFGDYRSLQEAAHQQLFAIVDPAKIDAACREASEHGFGWFEDSHSLQIHASLIERLPSILRIYIGAATSLLGDLSAFDLIKIHIRSGKASLMKFDDFDNQPLPRLRQRIKIRLREQEMDIFDYDGEHAPSLLYHKSRYINEEYPRFAEQADFEEQLNALKLHDLSGYGPSPDQFYAALRAARWDIEGFGLVRSKQLPDLDESCGKYFTYRQFVESGETQARTGIENIPRNPATYTAYRDLAVHVLDPVVEYFGMVELTFGFCSASLAKQIKGRIAPDLDQHAGYEVNTRGKPICSRGGAACDFLIADEDMEEVALWIMNNTNVDRVYFYGRELPIHVSYSDSPARQLVRFIATPAGRLMPRVDSGWHQR